MNILLDTNVISEVRRPKPSRMVLQWLDQIDEDRTFLSVVSLAEIRLGICRLEPGRKRETLSDWATRDLPNRFDGRILPITPAIATAWGDLVGDASRSGVAPSAMDAFLAATAIVHDLTLATHNAKDFKTLGFDMIDPWAV